jgi:hypothetical protein
MAGRGGRAERDGADVTVEIQPLTGEPAAIPGFAYRPHGGLTATVIYYKQLAPPPR